MKKTKTAEQREIEKELYDDSRYKHRVIVSKKKFNRARTNREFRQEVEESINEKL